MNLAGLYELFEKISRNNQWIGFFVGLTIGVFGVGTLVKFLLPGYIKGRHRNLEEENKGLRSQKHELAEDLATTKAEHARVFGEVSENRDTLQQLSTSLNGQLAVATGQVEHLKADQRNLHEEITRERIKLAGAIADADDARDDLKRLQSEFASCLDQGMKKRWIQPVAEGAAAFVPLATRQMTIISVLNLKGGVGKTTLTANLGVALARRGMRVLMVDLDVQGSLSNACLSFQERKDALTSSRFVHEIVMEQADGLSRAVFRNAIRLEDLDVGSAHILAANDALEEAESVSLSQWLLGKSGDDIRFRLRAALHDPAVRDEYDIVLLDCPPRLSTGCVNGLVASDYVLIPVMLEPFSTEATPRLLKWLRTFKQSCCPELSVLGIVANRVKFHSDKPIQKQRDLWAGLKDDCHRQWGHEIRFFDKAMVKQFAGLPTKLAALAPEGEPAIDNLARTILEELPPYARHPPATVPSISHPSAQSIGGV